MAATPGMKRFYAILVGVALEAEPERGGLAVAGGLALVVVELDRVALRLEVEDRALGLLHALDALGSEPTTLLFVQCTSPFLDPADALGGGFTIGPAVTRPRSRG